MEEFAFSVMREIGNAIGSMHDNDVVHGDLTTSNIMIRKTGSSSSNSEESKESDASSSRIIFSSEDIFQIVLIDFGLGMTQCNVEDKAVDLYVLERAFLSTHPGSEKLVHATLLIFVLVANTLIYDFIL